MKKPIERKEQYIEKLVLLKRSLDKTSPYCGPYGPPLVTLNDLVDIHVMSS